MVSESILIQVEKFATISGLVMLVIFDLLTDQDGCCIQPLQVIYNIVQYT